MEKANEAKTKANKALNEAIASMLSLIDIMVEEPSWEGSPSGTRLVGAYAALIDAEVKYNSAFRSTEPEDD